MLEVRSYNNVPTTQRCNNTNSPFEGTVIKQTYSTENLCIAFSFTFHFKNLLKMSKLCKDLKRQVHENFMGHTESFS